MTLQTLHLCVDMQDRYLEQKPGAEALVGRVNRLVAGLEQRGIDTAWVFYGSKFGAYAPDVLTPAERPAAFAAIKEQVAAFSPWHPALPITERSAIFVKPGVDARFESPLNDYLKRIGNPRELYSGVNGQPCVGSSAIGGIREGQQTAIALAYTLSDRYPDMTATLAQRVEEIRTFTAKRLAEMQAAEQALDRGYPESQFSSLMLTGAKAMARALEQRPLHLLAGPELATWLGQPPSRPVARLMKPEVATFSA